MKKCIGLKVVIRLFICDDSKTIAYRENYSYIFARRRLILLYGQLETASPLAIGRQIASGQVLLPLTQPESLKRDPPPTSTGISLAQPRP